MKDQGLREALEREVMYSLQCSRIGRQWPDEQVAAAVLSGLDDKRRGWDTPGVRPVVDRRAVKAAIEDELDGEGVVSYGLAPKLTERVMDVVDQQPVVDREAVRERISKAVGNWGKPADDATDAVMDLLTGGGSETTE